LLPWPILLIKDLQSIYIVAILIFEWDPRKDVSNQRKHGISFSEASSVFEDDLARLIPDPVHSNGEQRLILMGMSSKNRLVLVHHCEREGEVIRIFSARKASRNERDQYEDFAHA
jgi:uncharacterized DUF497 family protein